MVVQNEIIKEIKSNLELSSLPSSQLDNIVKLIISTRAPEEALEFSKNFPYACISIEDVKNLAPIVTAKLFCHRNCSPKLSKNIKKLLPIMPSITAHMSYLFWSPKEKRLVHPTRDVNWRRFQEDFEEILEA